MQTLETINVGQAPNDGTGEDHRSAFQKVNANFGKVVEGVGEASAAAQAAGDVAAAAVPAAAKGVAGGVAPLDAEGKIPAQNLPENGAFVPMAQKGVADGVATLGADGKVSPDQLPNAVDAIPLAEKGVAGGVATLTEASRLPTEQYPYSAFLAGGTDANSLSTPGLFHINSDANATAALNWPVQLAGTLNVEAVAGGNMQVTQTYTTRNGTGGVFRTYKRVRFGASGGTWGTWQEVARAADTMQHGQCYFTAASGTQCVLLPLNGNGLVINGKQCRIPSAGATVTNAGLTAGALYYAYAKDDGAGVVQIEFQGAASAPHSRHIDGVEIKTGDPSRTLVGMAYTNNPAGFINFGTTRWVSSWFNRKEVAMSESPTNSPTSSTQYVKLTNGLYPMLWAGDSIQVAATGILTTNTAGMGGYHVLTVNGTSYAGGMGYTLQNAGYQYPSVCVAPYTAQSDGMFNFALYGSSGSASAVITFKHDLNCRWPQ